MQRKFGFAHLLAVVYLPTDDYQVVVTRHAGLTDNWISSMLKIRTTSNCNSLTDLHTLHIATTAAHIMSCVCPLVVVR
jgi:hypothetical protein